MNILEKTSNYWPLIVGNLLTAIGTLAAVYYGSHLAYQKENRIKIFAERREAFSEFKFLEMQIRMLMHQNGAFMSRVQAAAIRAKYPELLGADAKDESETPEARATFLKEMQDLQNSYRDLYKLMARISILFPKIDQKKIDTLLDTERLDRKITAKAEAANTEFGKSGPKNREKLKRMTKEALLSLDSEWIEQGRKYLGSTFKKPFDEVSIVLKEQIEEDSRL